MVTWVANLREAHGWLELSRHHSFTRNISTTELVSNGVFSRVVFCTRKIIILGCYIFRKNNNVIALQMTLNIAPLYGPTPSHSRSGIARVFKGSHSFTCSYTRLSTNGMNHTCSCLPSRSWSSFTDTRKMEDWVGLGATMVCKQSAQDRYVTEITVISCSDSHASPATEHTAGYKRRTHDLSGRQQRR